VGRGVLAVSHSVHRHKAGGEVDGAHAIAARGGACLAGSIE
jgi:hypothetical protein